MIRDSIKNEAYFDEWIPFAENSIKKREDDLVNKPLKPYGRVLQASFIGQKLSSLIVMRYSRGDDIAALRDDVEHLLAALEQVRTFCDALPPDEQKDRVQYERLSFDRYLYFFLSLCFVVCLDMGEDYIRRMLAVIGNAGKDALLDRIAVKLGDHARPLAEAPLFAKQYTLLFQALDAPEEDRPALVRKFLDGWYKGNRNRAAWYDNHKGEDTGYVGYWCFEAALVVKLFGIDDTTFRTHQYYPADLVHHA